MCVRERESVCEGVCVWRSGDEIVWAYCTLSHVCVCVCVYVRECVCVCEGVCVCGGGEAGGVYVRNHVVVLRPVICV